MRTLAALLLTSFTLLSASSYAAGNILDQLDKLNIPRPAAELTKVAIKGISLQEIQLRLDTAVKNPYPVALPKAGLDLGLNIEGTSLAKVANTGVAIAAGKSTPVPFDIKFAYQDLVSIYKKVTGKEALKLGLDGKIKLPLPVKQLKSKGIYFKGMPTELAFPFKADKLLPAVLPAINLRDFKIHQPTADEIKAAAGSALAATATSFVNALLSGSNPGSAVKSGLGSLDMPIQTEFKLVLNNNAAAQVAFSNLKYDLFLGTEKFLSGAAAQIENKGKESIVTVRSAFPIKSVSEGIAKAISAKKATFKLNGSSGMKIPSLGGEGDVPFSFDHKGNLSW